MRVPLPIVFILALATVGGVWFGKTWHKDFMKEPSENELLLIKQRTESSFPREQQTEDAVPAPPAEDTPQTPPEIPPKPPIDLGDLTALPTLQQYGERSLQGAAPLLELAQAFEEKGEFQRALLAWERVLDLSKADDAQTATAISAIRRLRPTLSDWNTKPEAAIVIQLQTGTGKTQAKLLKPVLEALAKDLEQASSGIVKITPVINAGKDPQRKGTPPVPVALWLTGMQPGSGTTEVLSFTTHQPEMLKEELARTVFQLIRDYLAKNTSYNPPAPLAEGESAMDALTYRVTRLCWNDLSTSLNLKANPTPLPVEPAKSKSSTKGKPSSKPSPKPKAPATR